MARTDKQSATEIAEGLRRIRERLTPEGAWCQDYFAETLDGEQVEATDPRACRWCLQGARALDAPFIAPIELARVLDLPAIADWDASLDTANWQDAPERTQAEVLALLDARIAHYSGEAA